MTIRVLFFASLREKMGRASDELDAARVHTVAEAWTELANGAPMPPNLLMAVNQEYVSHHAHLKDGDELAFFPPVTGG